MVNWKDYLPNFKEALVGFYDERLKDTLESKSQEYKTLLEENIAHGKKTQKTIVVIAVGIFLLIAIYCFWKD